MDLKRAIKGKKSAIKSLFIFGVVTLEHSHQEKFTKFIFFPNLQLRQN